MQIALDRMAWDWLTKQALDLSSDLSHPQVRVSLGQDLDDRTAPASESTPTVGPQSFGLGLPSRLFTPTLTCETLE